VKELEEFSPQKLSTEPHDEVELLLNDWVRDSMENMTPEISGLQDADMVGPITIPKECLFSSLESTVIEIFFEMVYTDGVGGVGMDKYAPILLRLAICAQLSRPAALLEKRLKKIDRDRSYLNVRIPESQRIGNAIKTLWNRGNGDLTINCGPPVHVNVLTSSIKDIETCIVCHGFMLEKDCGKFLSAAIDGVLSLEYVPIDVVREILHYVYFREFDYQSKSVSESAIKFWITVASMALMGGSIEIHAAAFDRIIGILSLDNWETIAVIVHKYDTVSGSNMKQLKEAVLAIGARDVVDRIMKSKTFNAVNTYMYTKAELPGVVSRVMCELGFDFGGDSSPFYEQLHALVTSGIEAHLYIARTLRAEFERYQEMNADPVGDSVDGGGVVSTVKRYLKSLGVSHKKGPSVFSAMRDTAIFVAVIAIVMAYLSSAAGGNSWLGQTQIARFVADSSVLSQAGILGTNVTFVAVALYLLYRGIRVQF